MSLYHLDQVERFKKIPSLIRNGSTLGIVPLPSPSTSFLPPNSVPLEDEHFVDEKLEKWRERGKMVGPFRVEEVVEVAGPIQSSPIKLVDKAPLPSQPVRKRIVENFSYPYDPVPSSLPAANDNLNPDDFECTWTRLYQLKKFYRPVKHYPEARVLGLDFEDCFEHISLHESAKPRLVFYWKDRVDIRQVAPFGLRTTPGESGNLVDFRVECVERRFEGRVRIMSQVDDLSVVVYDPSISDDEIIAFIESFGWHLNKEKIQSGTRRPTHNGIEWDMDEQTMTLPKGKLEKFVGKLEAMERKGKMEVVSLKEMESLTGSLQYVAAILPHLRPRLRVLYRFRASFPDDRSRRHLLDKELRCIRWWISFLRSNDVSASFAELPCLSPLYLTCDASNSGIGLLIRNAAPPSPSLISSFSLPEEWRLTLEAYIGNPEAWAVEATVEATIRLGAKDSVVIVKSDNDNVVKSWSKGWSRNALLNLSIFRLLRLTALANIALVIEYIPTDLNPSDPVSRFLSVPDSLDLSSLIFLFTPPGTVGGSDPYASSTPYIDELESAVKDVGDPDISMDGP